MFTTKNLLKLIGKNFSVVAVIIIITMTSIFFIKKEIERLTNSIALNNKLESDLKKRTELFGIIEENIKIIGNNDKLISEAFIPSNDISNFTEKLDYLGSKYKAIQSYKFETPVESGTSEFINTSSILYSNNLTLGINDFSKYLKDFENLPYFTKIEGLNISSQSKSGWIEPSNITFKAKIITKTTK